MRKFFTMQLHSHILHYGKIDTAKNLLTFPQLIIEVLTWCEAHGCRKNIFSFVMDCCLLYWISYEAPEREFKLGLKPAPDYKNLQHKIISSILTSSQAGQLDESRGAKNGRQLLGLFQREISIEVFATRNPPNPGLTLMSKPSSLPTPFTALRADILLQTREWFPLAWALVALSAFRETRMALAAGKHQSGGEMDASAALGDDALAASSGQVIVGV
uniref:Uncharacterized protein n=1 Tax=Kalanchoe fedtschenkoi TaxID=63787 RepID=A0A7N0VCS8_KALFE